MKNLFISQPMKDKTNEEIEEVRNRAIESAKRLLNDDVTVLESFFKDVPHEGNQGLWCLGESLKLLSKADIVYFADSWQNYRGCRIEHECADEYGITIVEDYRESVCNEHR